MAIYHLHLAVISRSGGRAASPGGGGRRSVVAAAAYRSGEALYSVADGKVYRFEKTDIVHNELIYPDDAYVHWDRETLWNNVEAAERRKDAQLARDLDVAIPRELSREQQIELVRSFVKAEFVSRGMIADFGIHCPTAADGGKHPHAHILLTLRRLDPASKTGFSPRKERRWNEPEHIAQALAEARKRYNDTRREADRIALQAIDAQRNVQGWRKAWQDHANHALERTGSAARIDHRTLEAQGIFRLPQRTLGVARHIEKAYDYIRERVTHWIAVKQRAALYADLKHYRQRDSAQLMHFVLRLNDIAEEFASRFKRTHPIPEVPLDR